MTPEDRVQELFHLALETPPRDRDALLLLETHGDEALLARVRKLLSADGAAADKTLWDSWAADAISHAGELAAVGEMLGPYRLVERIGRGGMGTVYRAVRADDAFEKSVAVKRLAAGFGHEHVAERLRIERRILAELDHPNIARLLDGGAGPDGSPYLIMEYVDGVDPLEYARRVDLSLRGRLELFRLICDAVQYAHQRMVVHRDLKPANILVTAEGTPKLLDFGIAKVVDPDPGRFGSASAPTATHLMTARYASPEQVRGEGVTAASDIYSLGVILHELLTGRSPYTKLDRPLHELSAEICDGEPRPPSVWAPGLRGDLDRIVLKALRKNPTERYASAAQFSDDILRHLEGRPVLARGDGFLYVASKMVRRHWLGASAAAAALFGLTAGLIVVERARAQAERRLHEIQELAHAVLFDYHDAIEQLPGSTPVRARLAKDALGYLDRLSREADTPALRREIVDAYVRVSRAEGDMYQGNLGDTAGAKASADKAVAAAELLLRQDSGAESRLSAAAAYEVRASLLYSEGKLAESEAQYRRDIALREGVALEPRADLANRLALATALRHLADLEGGYGFQNLGRTAEALALYARAASIAGELSRQHPEDQAVAHAHYQALLSSSAGERGAGHLDRALALLREALSELERSAAVSPLDVNVKVETAGAEVRLGGMLVEARHAAEALPHMARAAEILEKLCEADPKNLLFRRDLEVVDTQWEAAQRSAGDLRGALATGRKSVTLALALLQADPHNSDYRADVGIDRRKLAETMLAAGQAGDALAQASQAEGMLCANTASNAYLDAHCGRAVAAAGAAELALGKAKPAADELARAESIAAGRIRSDPMNAIYRSDLARAESALGEALERMGRGAEARAAAERALGNWDELRRRGALTAEDAAKAADTSARAAKWLHGAAPK